MDAPIVNWIVPLHDVPQDFDKRSALFNDNEIHFEREQSGSYRLHSPKFTALPVAEINRAATELIGKINLILGNGQITMGIPIGIRADGVQVTLVTSDLNIPTEILGSVVAESHIPIEFTVVTLSELPQALRDNKNNILARLPPLPAFVFSSVLAVICTSDGSFKGYVIAALSMFWGMGFIGLTRGYNVALYSEISVAGKIVHYLKLIKPKDGNNHEGQRR